jgi:hypothetical protein
MFLSTTVFNVMFWTERTKHLPTSQLALEHESSEKQLNKKNGGNFCMALNKGKAERDHHAWRTGKRVVQIAQKR